MIYKTLDGLRDTPLQSYIEAGMCVIPVHSRVNGSCPCGKSNCESSKRPIGIWKGRESKDPAQVAKWQEKYPGCNWGIATGANSGVFVVDVDGDEGSKTLAEWQNCYGGIATATVKTHRGHHFYFCCPDNLEIGNKVGLVPGIDIRGEGGMVVAPPSVHEEGTIYEWITPLSELAQAPDWLLEMVAGGLHSREQATAELQGHEPPSGAVIPIGQRNAKLFQRGCAMRGQGMEQPEIEQTLIRINETRCEEELPISEVKTIAASAALYAAGQQPTTIRSGMGSESPLYFMQIKPKEMLAAEELLYMDDAQRGRYFMLLFASWDDGGKLPADCQKLYKLARATCSYEEFWGTSEPVFAPFAQCAGEHKIVHPGVALHYERQMGKYSQKVLAGRSGGKATQKKNKENVGQIKLVA